MSIDPEKDDIDVKTEEWHQQLKKIAFALSDELVFDAPPKALFGRTVNVKSAARSNSSIIPRLRLWPGSKHFFSKHIPKRRKIRERKQSSQKPVTAAG